VAVAAGATTRRILGIDPASVTTGWALVEEGPSLVDAGTIQINSRKSLDERLLLFREKLGELLVATSPDIVVAESPHIFRMSAAAALYQVRAMVLATVYDHQIPLHFITPKSAREKALGNGAATKADVQKHMHQLFHVKLGEDAADAACLALAMLDELDAYARADA